MRPDIDYLLLLLQRERYPSIDAVNAMHARENFLRTYSSKFDDYLTGSTYTPFYDAMQTQYLLVDNSPSIRVVLEDHCIGNNTNPAQYDCSRNWQGLFRYVVLLIRKYFEFRLL